MVEAFELKVDKWTFHVPKDLFYIENDCWARFEGDTAKVGITDFLQNMIGDIVFVNFLKVGSEVEQFDEIADFESVKSVLDVLSPVSGTIESVNEKLREAPELANKDPYGEGWFVSIKLANPDADKENLITAEGYLEVLKKKLEMERKKRGITSQIV
jgi:glycine cleavage system H protein